MVKMLTPYLCGLLCNVQNSHALCDLGLSIVKHLCHEQIDVEAMAKPVTLPEQLYKPLEKEDASLLVRFFLPSFSEFTNYVISHSVACRHIRHI